MQKVLQHLKQWSEAYLWIPLSLLSLIGAGWFAYYLSGRKPMMSADFLVDYGSRVITVALIIVFTSVFSQAQNLWMTLDQKTANPKIAAIHLGATCVFATIVAYCFMH
jgi:hypothetical protein